MSFRGQLVFFTKIKIYFSKANRYSGCKYKYIENRSTYFSFKNIFPNELYFTFSFFLSVSCSWCVNWSSLEFASCNSKWIWLDLGSNVYILLDKRVTLANSICSLCCNRIWFRTVANNTFHLNFSYLKMVLFLVIFCQMRIAKLHSDFGIYNFLQFLSFLRVWFFIFFSFQFSLSLFVPFVCVFVWISLVEIKFFLVVIKKFRFASIVLDAGTFSYICISASHYHLSWNLWN